MALSTFHTLAGIYHSQEDHTRIKIPFIHILCALNPTQVVGTQKTLHRSNVCFCPISVSASASRARPFVLSNERKQLVELLGQTQRRCVVVTRSSVPPSAPEHPALSADTRSIAARTCTRAHRKYRDSPPSHTCTHSTFKLSFC